jgi:folate-dependent phosphoribosylglycinamide formyltransferase PurN
MEIQESKKSVRIIILTVDHVYANAVVKALLGEFKKEIVLILESNVLLNNQGFFEALGRYIRISGYWYVFVQAVKLGLYKVASYIYPRYFPRKKGGKFYPYRALAEENSIKRIKMSDINSQKIIKLLKNLKADLYISVFFNQILEQEIIKIPKKGVINIHPAYLPDYKGVSPVFWALSNGEKEVGVSIHYIDEGIDTGEIIRRKKIKINNKDNEDSLYSRCVKEGIPLLISSINEISKGKVKTISNSKGRYFSLPTKEAVISFRKRGRRFFRLKDLLISL